ncbi:hypothetical protein [Nonomuraea sp. NPDC049784]|uniref:hypothetical protein n=1 Tax=Nonomuraea sp. NPDC049784 TaxID=3154361 RepID=UPI0033CB3482
MSHALSSVRPKTDLHSEGLTPHLAEADIRIAHNASVTLPCLRRPGAVVASLLLRPTSGEDAEDAA